MENTSRPGEALHRRSRGNYYLFTFLLGLLLAGLTFLPFLIADGGRFLFYGDFNVQQIPFYRLAHDAILEGRVGWDPYTDLGVNFVGSYSFYLLGSPFFWLTIPFPGEWLQYMMGPLLILKFACAALTAYVYLHRYAKSENAAMIASLLYAFSGFSVYNIFFNHFHEPLIFFPLLLASLDEYMTVRRRGVFAVCVAACCIVNYYFFVGMVTFCAVYFVVRMLSKSWHISVRDFLLLALEAVLGLGISMILLLPSILTVLQNYRVVDPIDGWGALLYGSNQRYVHILQSLFFPPDLPARPNFTPDSNSKWSSLGAWLPLFSMTGVIGWLQLKRKHWLKKLLWVLFCMALIPGLNASFQLMNESYYARWFYMLTLMLAAATMMALENARVDWHRALKWTALITVAVSVLIGAMPTFTEEDGEVVSVAFGLEQYPTRFWSYVAVALLSLTLTAFLLTFYVRGSRKFYRAATVCTSIVAVLYSIFFIALGKTQSDYPMNHIIPYALNGGADVQIDDLRDDNVRVDFYEGLDNSAMFWNVKSIQAFHSVVPGSIMEFYDAIGVQRDVASRPDTTHHALRVLTSVKYLFDSDHDDQYFAGEAFDSPAMPGWMYYGNANGFDIYENPYYLPMGFTFEHYISRSDFDALNESRREQVLLKALVLSDRQAERWSDMLTPLPAERQVWGDGALAEDWAALSENVCDSFAYTKNGFTAFITLQSDAPVFFSVPYEDGWSASVNGEKVQIEKVDVGFMAVRAPAGTSRIEFTYETPGLSLGGVCTVVCALLLLLYQLCMQAVERCAKRKTPVRHASMRRRTLADFAATRRAPFTMHVPIRIRTEQKTDPILEKKEGFTDDDAKR